MIAGCSAIVQSIDEANAYGGNLSLTYKLQTNSNRTLDFPVSN